MRARWTAARDRTDLEKEIKELTAAIKEEEDMRKKENEDYLAAKDEMTKAIAALEKAVSTMAAGTEGSFLHMSKGLKRALKVGQGFLAKKDIAALFQAAQPDDVPDADWEKLNREATFKQKYTGLAFQNSKSREFVVIWEVEKAQVFGNLQ